MNEPDKWGYVDVVSPRWPRPDLWDLFCAIVLIVALVTKIRGDW